MALNGKRIKVYSALRPEIQHLVRIAKEKLSVKGSDQDPLEIARELTEELIEAPITEVLEGEDDPRSRIAAFMSQNAAEAGKIRSFVEQSMDLPLSMHEVVSSSLKMALGKSMALVDLLSAVQKNCEASFPARWLSFATDVGDLFAASGGFAPGCAEVR